MTESRFGGARTFQGVGRLTMRPAGRRSHRSRRPGIATAALAGLAVLTLALPPPAAGAEPVARTFHVDNTHSHVGFTVEFMEITRVRGRFNEMFGTIHYDPVEPARSSVEVVIRTSSIDTGIDRRDADLRSERFFDAARHPAIRFQSRRVSKTGDRWLAAGDLTIRGVTQEIELPFRITGDFVENGRAELGVALEPITLLRSDFGVGRAAALAPERIFVADPVAMEITLRLRDAGPTADSLAAVHPEVRVPPAALDSLVGRYASAAPPWQARMEVLAGRLTLGVEGEGLFALVPIGPGRFRIEGVPGLVEVVSARAPARRVRVELGMFPAIELSEVAGGTPAAGRPAGGG